MPSRAESTRIYWDSCCFLSLIEGDKKRLPVLTAIADEAERGRVEIYTSVLTIAEVAFVKNEREKRTLDDETEKKIAGLWQPSSPFRLIELFPALAVRAKDLMRHVIPTGGKIPKPSDALHLATAEQIRAAEFQTYDQKLCKSGPHLPLATAISLCVPRTSSIVFPIE